MLTLEQQQVGSSSTANTAVKSRAITTRQSLSECARIGLHIHGGLIAIFWTLGVLEAPWGLLVAAAGVWMIARAEGTCKRTWYSLVVTIGLATLVAITGLQEPARLIGLVPTLSIPCVLAGLACTLWFDISDLRVSDL